MAPRQFDPEPTTSTVLDQVANLIEEHDFNAVSERLKGLEAGGLNQMSVAEIGRVHLYASEAHYHRGQYNEALKRGNLAIEHLKGTNAHEIFGQAKCRRGYVYLALGDPARGMDDFREALFAFRRIDNREGELNVRNCLAKCAFSEGQYLRARKYLDHALRLSEELGDEEQCGTLRRNLGRVVILLGDFNAAKLYLASEPETLASMTPANQCSCHLSSGLLRILTGDFNGASHDLQEAHSVAAQHSLSRQMGIYHEYAGELAFWQEDKKQAEAHYREAIRIGIDIAPEGDLISQSYRLLAELQVDQGQLSAAEESCDRAWQVAEKITERLELGAIQRVRGQIAVQQNRAEAAKFAFDESIRMLSEIGATYELARTHLQAGEAEILDPQYRLTNLFAARSLFETIGVAYWQKRVAAQIDRLIHADTIVGRNPSVASPDTGHRSCHDHAANRRGPFIAVSDVMREILEQVDLVKNTDATVLLLGETGVGKDHLARHIHDTSNRAGKPFEVVCAVNLPDHLWESELFGHTKGCFTGADSDRPGRLELADGGTVYLNEIGEIPGNLQTKLLDVLETKEVRRLGGWKTAKLDVRFIAASNQDLKQAVAARRFREDLYFRLNQMPILIPPLRRRKADIRALTAHFLEHYSFTHDRIEQLLASDLCALLASAAWPGNVRQLQHLLWRLVNLANGSGPEQMVKLGREILAGEGLLADPERDKIVARLSANDWNQRETARQMGISEATLRVAMKRLRIARPLEV